MTLREQLQERERQWKLFHEWEEKNLPEPRSLDAVMLDLSWIWKSFSEEVRAKDPDPEKLGVQRMHEALAKLRVRS